MAAQDKYRQCQLVKTFEGNAQHNSWLIIQWSWIPEKFADMGAVLRLKNNKGEW